AVLPLVLAGVSGVLIGLAYFGMLWWTVRRIGSARHPAALVAGSFLVRTIVAAGGIVVVSGGDPLPLVTAVAGFLVARTILIRVVGRPLGEVEKEARAAALSGEAGTSGP